MTWSCISHQCANCHCYATGHNQAHCPVHLAWEASQFIAATHAKAYHKYDITLEDVTTYIWDYATHDDELGQPGVQMLE